MQTYPRVPASRDVLVDDASLATRAWFRFFSDLPRAVATSSLETFAKVQNSTGSTIQRGTVVGFAGVGANNYLSVAPYLANGATPSLYILGILDETLNDSGSVGACCVWGSVEGVNTSAFNLGDILYASPTVAGGLTNVKPTAPNVVIPVAAVLEVGTSGTIFVRPTIEQQRYYGEFTKTTDQTPAAINTAYTLTFDNTQVANGISIGSPASRIVVAQSGLYQANANIQVSSSSSSAKSVWFWFRKNGADIANTARILTTDINNGYQSLAMNDEFSLAANDYLELAFAADSTAVTVDNVAATAFAPAAPAVVLSVTQAHQ